MNATLGSWICNLAAVLGSAVGRPPVAPPAASSGDALVTDGGDTFVTDTGDRIVLG